jgi:hypothetical protein
LTVLQRWSLHNRFARPVGELRPNVARDPEDDGLDIERFVGVLAETAKPRLSHSVIWQHKALCAS